MSALLHDTGHSLLSHASERVYGQLELLKNAARELSDLAAAKKKAGEVLSFCLTKTDAMNGLLARAKAKLMTEHENAEEYEGNLDISTWRMSHFSSWAGRGIHGSISWATSSPRASTLTS